MSVVLETGYLGTPYLGAYGYLSGQIHDAIFSQVEMKIYRENNVLTQTNMRIVDTADDPHVRTQVNMRIVDTNDDPHVLTQVSMKVYEQDPINTQVAMKVFEQDLLNTQVDQRIIDTNDDPHVGTQVEMKVFEQETLNTQVEMFNLYPNMLPAQVAMRIVDIADDPHVRTQVRMKILDDRHVRSQVEMRRFFERDVRSQVEMRIVDELKRLNTQVKIGTLGHYICAGYLSEMGYLTGPYLAARFCAHLFTQVEMKLMETHRIGTQTNMRIVDANDDRHLRSQVEMRVFTEKSYRTQVKMRIVDPTDDPHIRTQVRMKVFDDRHVRTQVRMRVENFLRQIRMQVNQTKSFKLNTQATLVIYNTEQMRILLDFPSRGTPGLGGNNWLSVQALSAGDFLERNLNTDIIEERCQTASGVVALWQLRCNTGNPNTFVDTIGLLNHNFTRSARVEVSGSDDAAFSTVKFSFVLETELTNMYWIAPTLPNQPAQYYQFSIQDAGNPAGVLSIGTIVFGSSIIMTRKEQFVNPVTFGLRHFKDSLETEGFTSVSNDRALRKFLNLTYSSLIMDGGNYRSLKDYMLRAKTDLKALVIPRPTKASRLAVFAKMSQIPEELHNSNEDDAWYVDMTFDWDEGL
jgi:hypothetical protein